MGKYPHQPFTDNFSLCRLTTYLDLINWKIRIFRRVRLSYKLVNGNSCVSEHMTWRDRDKIFPSIYRTIHRSGQRRCNFYMILSLYELKHKKATSVKIVHSHSAKKKGGNCNLQTSSHDHQMTPSWRSVFRWAVQSYSLIVKKEEIDKTEFIFCREV